MENKNIKKLAYEMLKNLNLNIEDFDLIEAYLKKSYDMNANVLKAIEHSKIRASEKGWEYTYWFFDVHETLIVPNYESGNIPTEFYPEAKEVLQMISERTDIKMHLYTCSWPHEIKQYDEFFRGHNISFDFLESNNPEVKNQDLGFYEFKPYYNVLFEDKAGFTPDQWKYVKQYLEENPDPNINKKEKTF